jgi:hypothetical protein
LTDPAGEDGAEPTWPAKSVGTRYAPAIVEITRIPIQIMRAKWNARPRRFG